MKLTIITNILLAFSLLFALVGCEDYLDKEEDDQKTEEEVFTRYEEVNKLVTHAYSSAKMGNRTLVWLNHFSSSAITDECEGSNVEGNITNLYNQGAWNPSSKLPGDDRQFWDKLYESVRHVNVTLAGIEKYKTPDNPAGTGDLEKRIGELYFIRGYLHWLLVRIYGEIPYIDYPIDPNGSMEFTKESVHAVIEKIINDAKEGYSRVQDRYPRSDAHFGRIEKGACLGLIAIARWTAAVPLYNGAKDKYGYTGTRVFEDEYTYDVSRWTEAKKAAKELLDFKVGSGNRYSLYEKYTANDFNDDGGRNLNGSLLYTRLWDMFHDYDALANEAVFFVTRDKDHNWQGDQYPPSRSGTSRHQPVQEQVDEYEYMAADGYGYPVYSALARNAGYNDENPYQNRDPRFYRDILYHGAPYRDNDNNARPMNTASGSDKIGSSNATVTGYYLRKFMKDGWNKSGDFQLNVPAVWRLPEFIYIYAEAVNESEGPTQEIYDLINKVRARSFMLPMPPTVLTNKELMREYIKRERRVEFFYENKRPFDCRFYLEASDPVELEKEKTFKSLGSNNTERSISYWKNDKGAYPKCQRMINGMRPVEDANGQIEINGVRYKMERFCVEERTFDTPKHYLFPIMNTELQVCPTLVQNPEW